MIAAIERFALAGGLELALTCDLIVVARDVKLGIPEVGGRPVRGWRCPPSPARPRAVRRGDGDGAHCRPDHRAAGAWLRARRRVAASRGRARWRLALAERIANNAPLSVAASKHYPQHAGHRPRRRRGSCNSHPSPGVRVRGRQGGPRGVRREAAARMDRAMSIDFSLSPTRGDPGPHPRLRRRGDQADGAEDPLPIVCRRPTARRTSAS